MRKGIMKAIAWVVIGTFMLTNISWAAPIDVARGSIVAKESHLRPASLHRGGTDNTQSLKDDLSSRPTSGIKKRQTEERPSGLIIKATINDIAALLVRKGYAVEAKNLSFAYYKVLKRIRTAYRHFKDKTPEIRLVQGNQNLLDLEGYTIRVDIDALRSQPLLELELTEEMVHLAASTNPNRASPKSEADRIKQQALIEVITDQNKVIQFHTMSEGEQADVLASLIDDNDIDEKEFYKVLARTYTDTEKLERVIGILEREYNIAEAGELRTLQEQDGSIGEMAFKYATTPGVYSNSIQDTLHSLRKQATKSANYKFLRRFFSNQRDFKAAIYAEAVAKGRTFEQVILGVVGEDGLPYPLGIEPTTQLDRAPVAKRVAVCGGGWFPTDNAWIFGTKPVSEDDVSSGIVIADTLDDGGRSRLFDNILRQLWGKYYINPGDIAVILAWLTGQPAKLEVLYEDADVTATDKIPTLLAHVQEKIEDAKKKIDNGVEYTYGYRYKNGNYESYPYGKYETPSDWLYFCANMLNLARLCDKTFIEPGIRVLKKESWLNQFLYGMLIDMGMMVPGGTRDNLAPGDVKMHDNLSKLFEVFGVPRSHCYVTTYDEATLATVMEASAIRIARKDEKGYDTYIFGKRGDGTTLVKKVPPAFVPKLQDDGSIAEVEAIEDVKPTHLIKENKDEDITRGPGTVTMGGEEVIFTNTGAGSVTITINNENAVFTEVEGESGKTVITIDGEEPVVVNTGAYWQPFEIGGITVEVKSRLIEEQTRITDPDENFPTPVKYQIYKMAKTNDAGEVVDTEGRPLKTDEFGEYVTEGFDPKKDPDREKKRRAYRPIRGDEMPQARSNAVEAIMQAQDILITGGSSLYTSILQHFLEEDFLDAWLSRQDIARVYVVKQKIDLETGGQSLKDRIEAMERSIYENTGRHIRFEQLFSHVILPYVSDEMIKRRRKGLAYDYEDYLAKKEKEKRSGIPDKKNKISKCVSSVFTPSKKEDVKFLESRGLEISRAERDEYFVEHIKIDKGVPEIREGTGETYTSDVLYDWKKLDELYTKIAKEWRESHAVSPINEKIFQSMDIRSSDADKEMSNEVCQKIGKAYGSFLRKKKGLDKSVTIVIGKDVRESSPRIMKAFIEGVLSTGVNVIDITGNELGITSTPLMYFSIRKHKTDGGVEVTASHLPKEYNGLKLMLGLNNLSGDEIRSLYTACIKENFEESKTPGKLTTEDPLPEYIKSIQKLFKDAGVSLDGWKTVVDVGGGTTQFAKELFKGLGAEVELLFEKPDGTFEKPDGEFKAHVPDPDKARNLTALMTKIRQLREIEMAKPADTDKRKRLIGIAYDTDGDRVGFVTEEGNLCSGNHTLALLAGGALKQQPGSNIMISLRAAKAVEKAIEDMGGVAMLGPVGYGNLRNLMLELEKKGIFVEFAGEDSGHVLYTDNDKIDDGMYTSAKFLISLASQEKGLEEFKEQLVPTFAKTTEARMSIAGDVNKVRAEALGDFEKTLRKSGYGITRLPEFPEQIRATRVTKIEDVDINEVIVARSSLHEPVICTHIESGYVDSANTELPPLLKNNREMGKAVVDILTRHPKIEQIPVKGKFTPIYEVLAENEAKIRAIARETPTLKFSSAGEIKEIANVPVDITIIEECDDEDWEFYDFAEDTDGQRITTETATLLAKEYFTEEQLKQILSLFKGDRISKILVDAKRLLKFDAEELWIYDEEDVTIKVLTAKGKERVIFEGVRSYWDKNETISFLPGTKSSSAREVSAITAKLTQATSALLSAKAAKLDTAILDTAVSAYQEAIDKMKTLKSKSAQKAAAVAEPLRVAEVSLGMMTLSRDVAAQEAKIKEVSGTIIVNDADIPDNQKILLTLLDKESNYLKALEEKLGCKVRLLSQFAPDTDTSANMIAISKAKIDSIANLRYINLKAVTEDMYLPMEQVIVFAKGLLSYNKDKSATTETAISSIYRLLARRPIQKELLEEFLKPNGVFILSLPAPTPVDEKYYGDLHKQAMAALIAA